MASDQQDKDARSSAPPPLISVSSASSPASTKPLSPSSMAPQTGRGHRHRKTVSFSDIDILVLPPYALGESCLPTMELAWEPMDRYSVTVDSMEATRSMLNRFGDGMSPLDRYNRVRNSSSRDTTTSLQPKTQYQEPVRNPIEDQPLYVHSGSMNKRNIPLRLAFIVVCFCALFSSSPYHVCRRGYSSQSAFSKMLQPRTIQGTEKRVVRKKETVYEFWDRTKGRIDRR